MMTPTPTTMTPQQQPIPMEARTVPFLRLCLWLLPAAPAVAQLALLGYVIAVRFVYPYDLEWMEGGMLTHALQFLDGRELYRAPSVDFVPQLYTPLYPLVVAALARIFGLGYAVGRAVSVVALITLLVLVVVAIVRAARREERPAAWTGALLAGGFIAAAYPWVACFYDLVRVDMFFIALVVGGLVAVHAAGRARDLPARCFGLLQPRAILAAELLAVAFFAKQTGVVFVLAGGAALLVMNPRAVPSYGLTAGAIGLGGAWLLERASSGWFWTYAFEIHQQHDTSSDRFWKSFDHLLGHFPFLTAVVVVTLVTLLVHRVRHRRLPDGGGAFLFWCWMFFCAVIVGAIGWSTQWAIFNAYIPAIVLGALAAGAALAPLCALAAAAFPERAAAARAIVFALAALPLAADLVTSSWRPARATDRRYALARGDDLPLDRVVLPSRADRTAGAALIRRLAAIEGEVFFPSHPFYPYLAGKDRTYAHRIGIKDVTYTLPPADRTRKLLPVAARTVARLESSLRERSFAAIVLDDGESPHDYPGLNAGYAPDAHLGRNEGPRTYYGKATAPGLVYLPRVAAKVAAGFVSRFDFETGRLDEWTRTPTVGAWGHRPESAAIGEQPAVVGAGGRYFASSAHGGDRATGTLVSRPFIVRGGALRLHVAGGKDPVRLRVELWLNDAEAPVRATTGPGTERLELVEWSLEGLRGKTVRIALVDESPAGHLVVDEIWERTQ